MTSHKIVVFDSWTEGSHHIDLLVPAFAERGLSLTLVHIGSWGNDVRPATEEHIRRVHVRDISWYGGSSSFERVLDVEKPDLVMMLSTTTFAHRAFLRYCKVRGIPTLHLYHSVMSVQITDDDVGSVKANAFAYTKFVLSMVKKLVTLTFPCYINCLLKTNSNFEDWRRLALDTYKLAVGKPIWQPDVAPDARTTKIAVYIDADREHANRVYGLPLKDVVAVGNPDLVRFGLRGDMLASHGDGRVATTKSIMYLDTGLATYGLAFKDLAAFIEHLRFTARTLESQGYSLCFKPHPAHNRAVLEQHLKGTGIELISNEEFIGRLLTCSGCIVEMSSITVVAAVLGMPILFANYNELHDVRYGPILETYPRGYLLKDVREAAHLLRADAERLDRQKLHQWAVANAGPLPSERMPERVADLVAKMIGDHPRLGDGAASSDARRSSSREPLLEGRTEA
jgi:hypothetical protein